MNSRQPYILLAITALLAAACMTREVRADRLDQELLRQAPKVMGYLKEKGYDNVGVLTFRMQRGEQKPSFRGSLINSNLADRLERALILSMDAEQPVHIITEARKTAGARIKSASYVSADSRKKLFDVPYQLPLNTALNRVTADAFVTGKVWVKPDYSGVTVAVESFGKDHPEKYERILSFDVKTDRYMLADLGQGFSLSRRGLKFMRGADDLDIIESVGHDVEATEAGQPLTFPEEFPVKLTIRYDEQPQNLEPDIDFPGPNNFSVKDPQEGQKVTFDVENVTDERLGLVLTVNAWSTLYEEPVDGLDPSLFTRWILEPHKKYQIKGYYQEDKKTFYPIVGLSDEQSVERFDELGGDEHAGQIRLYVFREQGGGVSDPLLASRGSSLRRVPAGKVSKSPARSWADVQRQILDSMTLKGGRGLMASGQDIQEEDLTTAELGAVYMTDQMTIRYWSLTSSGQ